MPDAPPLVFLECPKCGSHSICRVIVSAASKGKTNWDAPLNQWAGDHDVCNDCGHKWDSVAFDIPSKPTVR